MIPCCRIREMIRSSSGWSNGSPPLMVMIVVPSSARRSMRPYIVSTGTGFETSSYSLQYAQERLQRRMGTMCAITGWSVFARALPIIQSSRTRRVAPAKSRRTRDGGIGGVGLSGISFIFYLSIELQAFERVPLSGKFRASNGNDSPLTCEPSLLSVLRECSTTRR